MKENVKFSCMYVLGNICYAGPPGSYVFLFCFWGGWQEDDTGRQCTHITLIIHQIFTRNAFTFTVKMWTEMQIRSGQKNLAFKE